MYYMIIYCQIIIFSFFFLTKVNGRKNMSNITFVFQYIYFLLDIIYNIYYTYY